MKFFWPNCNNSNRREFLRFTLIEVLVSLSLIFLALGWWAQVWEMRYRLFSQEGQLFDLENSFRQILPVLLRDLASGNIYLSSRNPIHFAPRSNEVLNQYAIDFQEKKITPTLHEKGANPQTPFRIILKPETEDLESTHLLSVTMELDLGKEEVFKRIYYFYAKYQTP